MSGHAHGHDKKKRKTIYNDWNQFQNWEKPKTSHVETVKKEWKDVPKWVRLTIWIFLLLVLWHSGALAALAVWTITKIAQLLFLIVFTPL